MADQIVEHPRLAAIYDATDTDRSDLDAYLDMVEEFAAENVLDLGCGTGVLALLLSSRGVNVVGADPAGASLDVARSKPGASEICWIHGNATALPEAHFDLVVMTGNAAQAITDMRDWTATLEGVCNALKPGGRFIFETRDPEFRAWEGWTETKTRITTTLPGVGAVERWVEVTDMSWPLVSFRWTYVFESDGQVLTSNSTLRFHTRAEAEAGLTAHGFEVEDVREAPDRRGREFVFVARRAALVG